MLGVDLDLLITKESIPSLFSEHNVMTEHSLNHHLVDDDQTVAVLFTSRIHCAVFALQKDLSHLQDNELLILVTGPDG